MNLTVFSSHFRWKGLEPRVLKVLSGRGWGITPGPAPGPTPGPTWDPTLALPPGPPLGPPGTPLPCVTPPPRFSKWREKKKDEREKRKKEEKGKKDGKLTIIFNVVKFWEF